MFPMYLMPYFLFGCVLSVLTTFDDKMSNWPNVHTEMPLEDNCGKFGLTKMIYFRDAAWWSPFVCARSISDIPASRGDNRR